MYEYRCSECGLVFEVRQKFSDPPVAVCPTCGGGVEKLISQSAFTLKGGGWYDQGYSSSSSGANTAPSCPTGGQCCGGGAKGVS
jgi:putative FmdB family regulatory protein